MTNINNLQQKAVSTITKYALNAPRYTSYPTALKFEPLQIDPLPQALNISKAPAVSLYVHIPFCKTLCYYCGCNKIVTRHNEKADEYLDYLEKEFLSKRYLTDGRRVVSLHLGGGSPSFLSETQRVCAANSSATYRNVSRWNGTIHSGCCSGIATTPPRSCQHVWLTFAHLDCAAKEARQRRDGLALGRT